MKSNIIACLFLILAVRASIADGSASIASTTPVSSEATMGSSSQVARELKHEDWAPIHYQVYASEGHFKHPDDVFELLKKLEKIYESYTDEQTNGRKTKVAKLIQAADMNPRLCVRDYLKNFSSLVKYHSPFTKTLVPYLGHNFALFIDMCEEHVLHNLHINVGLIKKEFHDDMEEIARMIAEQEINDHSIGHHNLNKLWIHLEHVVDGVLEFLEHKFGSKLDATTYIKARDGKKKFYALFDEHVIAMCQVWIQATDPTESFLEYDISLKLKEEEATWLTYSHLCRFFKKDRHNVRSKLYRQFLRRHSKFSRLRVNLHETVRKFKTCLDIEPSVLL